MANLSNKEIEDKAIERIKKDYPNARNAPKGSGYDLSIGKRKVEVKGTVKSNYTQRIFLSGQKEHDAYKRKNYWLFRVFNVGTKRVAYKEFRASELRVKPEKRWKVRLLKK